LYLQLAEICAKAGYKRKESCYLVLASEHLWKKADYNTNVDCTKNSNSYSLLYIELNAYIQAVNTAYGVKFKNFNMDYKNQHTRICELSKEIHSDPNIKRFMYKSKDAPG
jgi:hypothetical protein